MCNIWRLRLTARYSRRSSNRWTVCTRVATTACPVRCAATRCGLHLGRERTALLGPAFNATAHVMRIESGARQARGGDAADCVSVHAKESNGLGAIERAGPVVDLLRVAPRRV